MLNIKFCFSEKSRRKEKKMVDPIFWTGFATCTFLRYTRNKVLKQHGAVGFLGHIGYGIGKRIIFFHNQEIYWFTSTELSKATNQLSESEYELFSFTCNRQYPCAEFLETCSQSLLAAFYSPGD